MGTAFASARATAEAGCCVGSWLLLLAAVLAAADSRFLTGALRPFGMKSLIEIIW
jgi:hypothetical protein